MSTPPPSKLNTLHCTVLYLPKAQELCFGTTQDQDRPPPHQRASQGEGGNNDLGGGDAIFLNLHLTPY